MFVQLQCIVSLQITEGYGSFLINTWRERVHDVKDVNEWCPTKNHKAYYIRPLILIVIKT